MNMKNPVSTSQRCKKTQFFKYLPKAGDQKFWLAVFLNESEKALAVHRVLKRTYKNKTADVALQYGLIGALDSINQEAMKAAEYVAKKGLLPFAWAGTKALEGVEVEA